MKKKLLGEPPSLVGYGLARLGHSLTGVKNLHPLEAEIWSSKKVDFVGTIALLNLRN